MNERILGLFAAALTLVSFSGCDAPPADLPDAIVDDIDGGDRDGSFDAARVDGSADDCEIAAECDDGLFCNGEERCAPGDPDANDMGCAPASDDACMPGQRCDEASDECVTECGGGSDDADGDGQTASECGGTDCDDADPNRFAGNPEICDAADRDEDCDSATFGVRDADLDSHPDARCCNEDGEGVRACGDDCDDARVDVHPGVPEVCDLSDNDCDMATDEGVGRAFYPDADHDGHGDPAGTTTSACFRPANFAESNDDCDDARGDVHPGAPEQCDAATPPADENCDGTANPVAYCSCSGDASRNCARPGACMAGTERCVSGSWGACSIAPIAEVCNSIDDDCDGIADEMLTLSCFADTDDDGYAAAGTAEATACPAPGRGSALGCAYGTTGRPPLSTEVDCAEDDPRRTPHAAETCDGIDNDCDATIDEGELVPCYADPDDDGYSAVGAAMMGQCPASGRGDVGGCPFGTTSRAPAGLDIDCGEGDGDRHRGGLEVCDGLDGDCDGTIDEGVTRTFYLDADNDGWGVLASTMAACFRPAGYADVAGDCDDTRSIVRPSAPEVCDAAMLDEDCDGTANPVALCACSDGSTRPCTRSGVCAAGIESCTTGRWGACSISPIAESCNGLDDDCDGVIDDRDAGGTLLLSCYDDTDDDGYAATGATMGSLCPASARGAVGGCPIGTTNRAPLAANLDCAEGVASRHPGAIETCDGLDGDCDGTVDEGTTRTFYRDNDNDSWGLLGTTTQACFRPAGYADVSGDCDDTRSTVRPGAPETCDAAMLDEDCDGVANPVALCACTDGASRACMRSGACAAGIESCTAGRWGACSISPIAESCNGLDDDCDGVVDDRDTGGFLTVTCFDDTDDDHYALATATMRSLCPVSGRSIVMGCPFGTTNRVPIGAGNIDCDDTTDVRRPGAPELCNGASEDCDGAIDEGLPTFIRYRDQDGDGREGQSIMACEGAPGTSAFRNDCDETSVRRLSVYVGAPELCDRFDDNCDGSGGVGPGLADPNEDRDADGYMPAGFALCTGGTLLPGDCNDDPTMGGAADHPGGTEVCDNRDNDCNGVADQKPVVDASCAPLAGGYAACSAGTCALVACQAGFADCDGSGASGCETNTASTTQHCGGCNLACAAGGACLSGVCDRPVDLALSWFNTCWRYQSGRVACFGNSVGLGTDSAEPIAVPNVTSAVQLAAYWRHSCVVTSTGTVQCWGNNEDGAVGVLPLGSWEYSAVTVPGVTGIAEVDVGDQFTCVRTTAGVVRCWGDNEFGQLGNASMTDSVTPVTVGLPVGWTALDLEVGRLHACTTARNGAAFRVYCWGANESGQLGNGGFAAAVSTPVQVMGLGAMNALAGGQRHTCGIDTANLPWCWGDNGDGAVGNGSAIDQPTPVTPSGFNSASPVIAIVAGLQTCAVTSIGSLWCWGDNSTGQLGNGMAPTDSPTRSAVAGMPGFPTTAIWAGWLHTCARDANGDYYCWGYNAYGQLGNLTTTDSSSAIAMSGIRAIADVSVGYNHSCARQSTGELECWGRNNRGQLGYGTIPLEYAVAQQVPGLLGTAQVAVDADRTCVRMSSGSLQCWGDNDFGALGDGTTTDRASPTPVLGISTAIDVDLAQSHGCAVLATGAVSCWGYNSSGALGDGTTTNRSTPVAAMITNATSVSCGWSSSCATTRSGQLYCWGDNFNGTLGLGDQSSRLVPTAVPGMTDIVEVAVARHTCARRASGQVLCWGYNGDGELGDGTRTQRLTPVPVLGLGGLVVVGLAVGNYNSCALIDDGSIRCWGDSSSGQIGDGGVIDRLTPRRMVGMGVYRSLAVSSELHMCASEVAQGVECWGENAGSQLGNNTDGPDSPVPVQAHGLP